MTSDALVLNVLHAVVESLGSNNSFEHRVSATETPETLALVTPTAAENVLLDAAEGGERRVSNCGP